MWTTGKMPTWFERQVLGRLDGARDGTLSYANESTRERDTLAWGCRRTAKQCAVAWWYTGLVPDSYREKGAPAQGQAVCGDSSRQW